MVRFYLERVEERVIEIKLGTGAFRLEPENMPRIDVSVAVLFVEVERRSTVYIYLGSVRVLSWTLSSKDNVN